MVKNPKKGEIYWFIDGEGGEEPREIEIIRYYPPFEDVEDYCVGYVLHYCE